MSDKILTKFDRDFDAHGVRDSLVAYKAGHLLALPPEHAAAARAAGAGRDPTQEELASIDEAATAPAEPPVDPAPVDPAPVDPAPVDPAPVDPAPVA